MSLPFVSVLVPTYNRNELLCDTLRCLLDQDYLQYEIVVVDQTAEHDLGTAQFLESIKERIRYFKLDSANVSAARNYAYEHCQGEIVVYFDDDMEIPRDIVRRIATCYENRNIDGLSINVVQNDDPLKATEKPGMIRTIHFCGQCMSFRRRVFEEIGLFHEWFGAQHIPAGEDIDFTYRAVQNGFKLFVNTGIAVRHVGNGASGGCERRRLGKPKETSDVDVLSGLIVYWRNRKSGIWGTVTAFWRGYHAYVFNRGLLQRRSSGVIAKHARFYRLFREMLRQPWLNHA